MLEKEDIHRGNWKVDNIEEEGRTKMRTPTANDNNDSHILPDIEGGPLSIIDLSRIMTVQQLPPPSPPTLPISNIGLPQSTHDPSNPAIPESCVSHSFGWETQLQCVPGPLMLWSSCCYPIPILTSSTPFPFP